MLFARLLLHGLFFFFISYKWHVPLTYVFQDASQDPKTKWMNISSDSGYLAQYLFPFKRTPSLLIL